MLKFFVNKHAIFLLLIGLLHIFCGSAFSQSYLVKQYTGEDGLPDLVVLSVTQDSLGKMWFVTQSCVTSFDGYDWEVFNSANSVLTGQYIKIKTDNKGNIWLLTEGKQVNLFYYNKNKWRKISSFAKHETKSFGLIDFDIITKPDGVSIAVAGYGSGLFVYDSGAWKNYTAKDGLPNSKVHDVLAVDDRFYIATESGISIFTGNGFDNRLSTIPGLAGKAVVALKDDGYKLWLLNRNALGFIENNTYHYVHGGFTFDALLSKQHFSILPIDSNRVMFSNLYSLALIDRRTKESGIFKIEDGTYTGGSTDLFIDREKNIWITGYRGVGKVSTTGFKNYYKDTGLFENEVTAITEVKPGHYVFGHNGGLTLLSDNKFKRIQLKTRQTVLTPIERVLDLSTDKYGNVWIAFEGSGFGKMLPDNTIEWFPQKGSLACSAEPDIWGNMYFITTERLLKYSNGKLVDVAIPNKIKNAVLRKIFFDENNNLFIATINSGIVKRSTNGSWEVFKSNAENEVNNVYSILFDDDRIYCGTRRGLYIVEGDSLKKYVHNDLKIDTPVYFLTKDKDGSFWFGTNTGVMKWDGEHIFKYSKDQGLAGIETNRDAGYIDSFNNLWIGTSGGLSKYTDTDNLVDNNIRPVIILDSVTAGVYSLPLNSPIKINYWDNNLTFYFKAVSFIDEKNILYKIKLEGYDDDWITLANSGNPHIRYTNLPGSKFKFMVKVSNSFGYWGNAVSSAEIKIQKPFYLQWWFFFIVISGSGMIWYLGFIYYKRIKYTETLESMVLERTKQLDASQKRYKQMFTTNQAIMLLIDASTGKILDANPSAVKYYGFDQHKLNEYNFGDIDDVFQFELDNIAVLKSELGKYYNSLHKTLTGKIFNVEVYLNYLFIDDKTLFYAIIHDITDRKLTEEALIESEEKYRLLVNNMQDGVMLVQDARIIYSNKAFTSMLGYQHGELDGGLIYDYVAEEYVDVLKVNYTARLKGHNLQTEYELKLLHKERKQDIYVIINAGIFKYEGKIAVIATIKDITEKKHDEETLKQLYTAVEQSPTSVIIANTEGIVEYVNPKCSDITGYTNEELVGSKSYFFDKEAFSPAVHEDLWSTIKSGNVWRGELPVEKKDGSSLWIHAAIAPIKDAKGSLTHYISIEDDITFEKYAREEIEKNEKLLNSVMSNLPVVFFMLDKAGIITFAKGRYFEGAGVRTSDLIGRPVLSYFEGYGEIKLSIERALLGEEFSTTIIFYGVQFEVIFVPLKDDQNNFRGSVGVAYDLTERYKVELALKKAKEEAEKSDRLKSDFLAQMSHEIRTPVNSILSFNSLLKEELISEVPEHLKEGFKIIESGGCRLIRTIDLILNMSQIHTGTYQPRFVKIDLDKQVLAGVYEELHSIAEIKNLSLQYIVEFKPAVVYGDNYTLGQIFINLVDNAIKYTKKGKVIIKLYNSENDIAVDVQDTGMGIAREFIPELFSPFSQEETGYSRRFEGTGLGLALVKNYVEINKGEISVKSKKGKGTTFTVRLKPVRK